MYSSPGRIALLGKRQAAATAANNAANTVAAAGVGILRNWGQDALMGGKPGGAAKPPGKSGGEFKTTGRPGRPWSGNGNGGRRGGREQVREPRPSAQVLPRKALWWRLPKVPPSHCCKG